VATRRSLPGERGKRGLLGDRIRQGCGHSKVSSSKLRTRQIIRSFCAGSLSATRSAATIQSRPHSPYANLEVAEGATTSSRGKASRWHRQRPGFPRPRERRLDGRPPGARLSKPRARPAPSDEQPHLVGQPVERAVHTQRREGGLHPACRLGRERRPLVPVFRCVRFEEGDGRERGHDRFALRPAADGVLQMADSGGHLTRYYR